MQASLKVLGGRHWSFKLVGRAEEAGGEDPSRACKAGPCGKAHFAGEGGAHL